VKDIIDGDVDLDKLAREELDEEKIERTKAELKDREREEFLKNGRKGKGH
jgi:hypothetical protein